MVHLLILFLMLSNVSPWSVHPHLHWKEEEITQLDTIKYLRKHFAYDQLRNASFLPHFWWSGNQHLVNTSMYDSKKWERQLPFLPSFCSFIQSHRYADIFTHNEDWFHLVHPSIVNPNEPYLEYFLRENLTISIIGDSTQSDLFHGLICDALRHGLEIVNAKKTHDAWHIVEFQGNRKLLLRQQWKPRDSKIDYLFMKPDVLLIHYAVHYHKGLEIMFKDDLHALFEHLQNSSTIVVVRGSIPQHFPTYSGQFEEMSNERLHDKQVHCSNRPRTGFKWREDVLQNLSSTFGFPFVSMEYLNDLPYLHPSTRCEYTWPQQVWSSKPCEYSMDCTHVACWTPWIYQPLLKQMGLILGNVF